MKKRLFSMLCILAVTISAFAPITIFAANEPCGANLTWDLDDDGTLTISGSGDMFNFNIYSDVPWYNNRYDVHKVVVQPGVTSIGKHAFYRLTNTSTIQIPSSISFIGEYAFDQCKKLSSINLPEGITDIKYATFRECTSLSQITIPEGVKTIDEYAFRKCSALRIVKLPDSLKTIGNYAFGACSSLTEITIPDGALNIGKDAFQECVRLETVKLPEALKVIPEYLFQGCENLTTINIPNRITKIEKGAFDSCNSLTSIHLPVTLNEIGISAFNDCTNLTDVYYEGSKSQWEDIDKNISAFDEFYEIATIHYGSSDNTYDDSDDDDYTDDDYTDDDSYTPITDTEKPVVYQFNCNTGTTVNRDNIYSITFDAKSRDNVKVEKIMLAVDGVTVDTNYGSTISTTIQTSGLRLGKNEIYIIVEDSSGNIGYSDVISIHITKNEKGSFSPTPQQGDIKVTVNGNYVNFDVPPQIINNRTMIPLRAVAEAFGAEVIWNPGTLSTVHIKGERVGRFSGTYIWMDMVIGDKLLAYQLYENEDYTGYLTDGSYRELDSPPVIISDRTLLPIRVVAELFGYTVGWDQNSQTVSITK